MRVCLLNESFPPIIDGVANVVMNYANILQTKGWADVAVGTPSYPGGEYTGYPYQVIPYKSINVDHFVKGYRAGNPFDFSELHTMTDFAPDIIHTHCPVTSTLLARMVRQQTDAPIVFTYHTKFDVEIDKALKSKFLQKEVIATMIDNIAACDEIWVVSKGAGENLRSLGFEGEYRVVDNGVDFAKGEAAEELVHEATKDYDLPEGVPVYLFVGRMVNYKGLPLIVDALTKVNEAGQDFRMVFVGSGSDEDMIKEKVKQQGIAEKCYFTGAIHDRDLLRAWNTRADLFLFPSVYDTNGIVVREAAACGTASILIAGSCASEMVIDGRNGYVIPESPEAMSELLLRLGNNTSQMHAVGQAAMDEIYLSWEDCVKKAKESYLEIIDNKKCGKYRSHKHRTTQQLYEFGVFGDELRMATKELFYYEAESTKEFFENGKASFEYGKNVTRERLNEEREAAKERLNEERENAREKFLQEKENMKEHWQHGIDRTKEMIHPNKPE